jgi:RNA polymerase sigma-70 factor (ECF subfamily)
MIDAETASDDSLVSRARGGDAAAFEELYRAHCARVYALCLRMTRDAAEAEDLTQEAFVRTWQKLTTFRGDSAFSTWLHRLTVNLVLTNRRSHTRRTTRVTVTEDVAIVDKRGGVERPDLGVDLEQAIAALPDGARRVFVLHDVEGYRHHEIAGMMGLAVGTTKAQLHRARRLLREALA